MIGEWRLLEPWDIFTNTSDKNELWVNRSYLLFAMIVCLIIGMATGVSIALIVIL